MASIQNYLNQIKSAVFGKDVRQAIHDAIEECYNTASIDHDNANMEVKLARGTHNTLNDRLEANEEKQENFSEQLDNSIQYAKDEITKIYNNGLRKCKATFGFSAIGSACSDCTTLEDEIAMLNKFKEIGITSFICCMYVNEEGGTFEIEDDLSLLNGTINYCMENGLSIPSIKLHFKNIDTIDGSFYSKLENLLIRLHNIFKVVNYETLFMWNERTDDLSNNYLTTALTSASALCTNVLKVKPAIALQGYTPIGKIKDNKSLIDSLKVIGINHYPHISAKGEDTVIADSINGWKSSYITENIKYIKNLNPNLDVYISESGLIASWRALCDPGYWSYDWQTYDNNTGKVCEIYYTGMLETLKNEDIPYIFGWFPHDFVKNTSVMKKMYDKYYNGGR
ncbi:hypothetical protein [Clostridium saudiense]|uniref:hypothetical protein n=1 Tax=Clostridium saudiense TaxID=1414720 RepID=UPI0004B981B0|nr:hypothetical protein [Clostridium saudiense]